MFSSSGLELPVEDMRPVTGQSPVCGVHPFCCATVGVSWMTAVSASCYTEVKVRPPFSAASPWQASQRRCFVAKVSILLLCPGALLSMAGSCIHLIPQQFSKGSQCQSPGRGPRKPDPAQGIYRLGKESNIRRIITEKNKMMSGLKWESQGHRKRN